MYLEGGSRCLFVIIVASRCSELDPPGDLWLEQNINVKVISSHFRPFIFHFHSATMASSLGSNAAVGRQEERLSALLSSPQFSVASYLNSALAQTQPNDDDDLQRTMAELALQLQLQTQACHEEIGRIGAELQAILPRCASDVKRIGVGLEGMKMDAQNLLEATTTTTSDEVSSSLETLSTLHALRSNLSRTKEILTAAATWDTTLSSIAPLLAQQNLTEAVHALARLESGARALRGMPSGQEERGAQISKIRLQIQTLLNPQLKHALQNMNTRLAPLQQCVALFRELGTMETLQTEYVKNRPGTIHKAWFSYTPTTSGEEDIPGFVTWLPNWYDAVLSLLAEERRQSVAVFGPHLAPEMITKVLGECFRPILSSFVSRLETVYSSSPSNKKSLESVCAVYEATLQFLSLAYESVAGGWLDVAEQGTTIDSKALYEDVTAVFMQIASPFVTYQERLPTLEQQHSGVAKTLVAKEFQQTASSVNMNASLDTLQDATERLKGLSSFIFPLAESAVARFELLNGGHRATPALATVDTLLASHASELAIAVRTLSAAMTANEDCLAENFDEQHVLCALQVLKVAGTFRRDLRGFETKTRERLGLLAERMIAHDTQEKELQAGGMKFPLPDSLSAVEIDSMLTAAVCSEPSDDESNKSLMVLQRLASTENSIPLYPEAEEATSRLARSCHSFVFDVCSSVPRKHLADMPSMASWKEKAGAGAVDSYGTLPQAYITGVGEHMLALVQALEPFVADPESLALANEVMDNVRSVALDPWREFVAAAGAPVTESVIQSLVDGKALSDYVIAGAMVDDEEEEDDEESNKEGTAFCNAWLDVVGLAVTGQLLERIMRVNQLTPRGCEHLSADLNYLINVLSALGVSGHPHPLVNHFAELVMMDEAALRDQIMVRDRTLPLSAALCAAETRLSSMRGISTNY